MASSVQFENTYPEDERWITAGADALAVHFAACCYADRKNTDGRIPKVMVDRVALAVPAGRVPDAIESLIETGFWTAEKDAYRIVNFVEDKIGLSAEEKLENRARWAADKKWRRQHNAGNHAECPPEKCRQSGKVSHADTRGTPTKSPAGVPSESYRTTRPDSLRLDSTRLDPKGEASESRSRRRPAGPASAGATASPRSRRRTDGPAPVRPDVVTLADLPEAFATLGLEGHELASAWDNLYADPESALYGTWSPRAAADPADGLDGLIPAGGADGAGR